MYFSDAFQIEEISINKNDYERLNFWPSIACVLFKTGIAGDFIRKKVQAAIVDRNPFVEMPIWPSYETDV